MEKKIILTEEERMCLTWVAERRKDEILKLFAEDSAYAHLYETWISIYQKLTD